MNNQQIIEELRLLESFWKRQHELLKGDKK